MGHPVSIHPEDKNARIMELCWILHGQCNNRCSYCQPYNYMGTYGWLTLPMAKSFVDQLFAHYKNRASWRFFFTGGEPTLWPDFIALCEYLKAAHPNVCIGVNTNGSRQAEFWVKLAPYVDELVVSYHSEFPREEHLLQWIPLVANQVDVSVRLMMHPDKEKWDRGEKFASSLISMAKAQLCRFCFEYVPLQENFGGDQSYPMQYDPDQNEFWRNQKLQFDVDYSVIPRSSETKHIVRMVQYSDGHAEKINIVDMVAKNKVNFRGWTCSAGEELLFISADGELFGGGCRVGGKIGNIGEREIAFPTDSLTCPLDFCPCGSDIQIRKFDPKWKPPMRDHKRKIFLWFTEGRLW